MTSEALGARVASHAFAAPSDAERIEAGKSGALPWLWARVLPDESAVISPSGDRTFAELAANVARLVRALRHRGVVVGDAIAIVASNRVEFVESVLAATAAGLRYTVVNRFLTADEVAYVIDDCGAKAIVGDAVCADTLSRIFPSCTALSVRLAIGGDVDGFESYDDALAVESPRPLDDAQLGSRMLYTSGTTGRPKGVVRPANYSTRLEAITTAPAYRAGSGQRNLCTGPLYHGGPLSFSLSAPLAAGVGIVLMERWDAEAALELIARHRITHTHMVPTMFHRLLRLPDEVRRRHDVSSLTYVLHGAAPCTVETKRAMLDWFGPVLWEYFAATEGSGASCSPAQWRAKPGTVGLPPSPTHVRILDAAGAPCPLGVAGTIFLERGESDFVYWNDPEKTEAARRGGYFTVGDVGYLDEDGYLFVTDRGANLIVRGGVNVYPAESEAVLVQHPSVRDVCVVGVPSSEWGEEVHGVVELEPDVAGSPELAGELVAFCRSRLAPFKCPRTIEFVRELPRQDNGKLYREALRERARARARADDEASSRA